MSLTEEQQLVVDTLQDPEVNLVLTPACAGSGKTHTLIELAHQLNPTKGLYLAYNKAIAEEAKQKFKGTTIECLTVHSMAYKAIVRQYGLQVGWFGPRNVTAPGATYNDKKAIVNTLDSFLVSPGTSPSDFLDDNDIDPDVAEAVLYHLDAMANGQISCNHNFYLKMYHSLLATNAIPVPEVDLLLLDEAGDLNPVTLEIFRLINSPKKIAVGDSKQNIYGFNGTINGFNEMEDEGVTVPLTQSFRVAAPIAQGIEAFIQQYVDKDFIFTGRTYPKTTPITSTAYIARNNSGLIEEMFRLKEKQEGFNTTRKIGMILELPLVLANLSNGKKITEYKYKHIETLRAKWENNLYLQTTSITKYVMGNLKGDTEITGAFNVVARHGPSELNTLTKYANECAKSSWPLTLTTAHSSKGLEFDAVEIAPDLSSSTLEAIEKIKMLEMSPVDSGEEITKLQEELLLAYVATSRAKVKLTGAKFLLRA